MYSSTLIAAKKKFDDSVEILTQKSTLRVRNLTRPSFDDDIEMAEPSNEAGPSTAAGPSNEARSVITRSVVCSTITDEVDMSCFFCDHLPTKRKPVQSEARRATLNDFVLKSGNKKWELKLIQPNLYYHNLCWKQNLSSKLTSKKEVKSEKEAMLISACELEFMTAIDDHLLGNNKITMTEANEIFSEISNSFGLNERCDTTHVKEILSLYNPDILFIKQGPQCKYYNII